MSYSKLQPTIYNGRNLEQQLTNNIFSAHDLACGCPDPPSHLTYLLINNCQPKDFNKEEKKKLQKWLGTLTEETTGEEEETGFSPGDLEKLFQEEDDTPEEG